jgi:predicted esterase
MSGQAHSTLAFTVEVDTLSQIFMTHTRVLFIHGLESRANGTKTILLREQGFDVRAHDMDMGLFQINRKNSVVRMALRSTEVQFAVGTIVATIAMTRSPRGALWASAIGAGWYAVRKDMMIGNALAKSFAACVDIQNAAIGQEKPDIVVGSSWGGAVAVELIRRGTWSGPTVLLAPAVHRVAAKTRRNDIQEIAQQLRGHRIIIFHDPKDDVVPFGDSEELARAAQVELRAVNAGGHRLLGICYDGQLAETLRALALETIV